MVSLPKSENLVATIKDMTSETKTGIILTLTFFFSLFLSSYFIIGVAVKGDYAVSGGSDAYYNMRIVQFILSTHHQLLFDPGLNFPTGLENPRPPFFMWLAVLLGYAFSPFLGGVYHSTMTMFLEITAIGGAFIVFPTYFLGKELFGRRVGLIAAVLVAMSPLTLMKSIATIGLFDIFTALFGIMFIYYFLRAVNVFKFEPRNEGLIKDIFNSIKSNPLTIVYSLLAGVSLAASMLTWVGTISLILILAGAGVVQVIIYTIKKKSSLSIFVSNLFFGSGFIIAFPWYYVAHFIAVRFDYPLIIWGVLLISSLYFLIFRKRPWLLTLGVFVLIAAAAIVVLDKVDRQLILSILSGQHYFIKNKIYDTIAEAQSLPLGEDMIEYGPFMFFASFIGLAYLVYKWVRTADFNTTLAVLYFGGIIVISMIASKFLYFGAVAASILTGYILVKSFELLAFRETVEKAKERPIRAALRKELKFSHYVAIFIVVFLLIVPTTFYAVDSAIPFNNKTYYDEQIYNATPSFLRPLNYSPPYYLGALGVSLDLPSNPWDTALSWFQNQDAQLPPDQRPAMMSWWDYGFQTLEQGGHPVMADNFQDGIYPAAQLLMAQNESQMISVMITRMLDLYSTNGTVFNTSAIIPTLEQYIGINGTEKIMSYESNPDKYIPQIYANPSYYGQYESIQGGDAKYILVEHFLSNTYSLNTIINLYSAVEAKSNSYMSYIAVDYGLFPFSGTDTGIFYAPSYLGDFPYVNASGEIIPISFYNITVTDTNGNTYPLQDFPSGDTAVNYTINYTPAFYNTTIYRAFIGYPPTTIGASSGVPGLTASLQNYYPMQAWNLSNFEVVYTTVFWNPYTDYQNHSNAWKPVSLEQGYYYLKNHDGTVDLYPPASQVLPSDVVFIEYYPGAIIHGRVTDSSGQPVSGIRVTIADQYGIPHQSVITNSTGYYSLYAVAGNDTVTYSTGPYNPLFMVDNNTLSTYNVTITQSMANRESYDPNGTPTWNITHNVVIRSSQVNGVLYLNLARTKVYIPNTDISVNGTIRYYNSTYNTSYEVNTMSNGSYEISNVKPYSYTVSAEAYGQWYNNITTVSVKSAQVSEDIPLQFGILNLTVGSGLVLTGQTNVNFSRGDFSVNYVMTHNYQEFRFPIGQYNVTASNGVYRDNFIATFTNNTTTSSTINFNRYYTVNFVTEINGRPVSSPVTITGENSVSQVVVTSSNGTGSFSTVPSVYSIYSSTVYNGIHYSYATILNVSDSGNVVLNLEKAVMVSGEYMIGNRTQPFSSLTVTGENSFISTITNSTGQFSVYLPPGEYSFVASSSFNSSLYVSSLSLNLSENSMELIMEGYNGYNSVGNLSYEGSSVTGLLASSLSGKPYYDVFISSGKQFTIPVQDGLSVSGYSFISPGYVVKSQSQGNITLRAIPVTVSIYASYSGNYPLTLYFNGTNSYSVSGTHWFNFSAMPGSYSITFHSDYLRTTSSLNQATVVPGAEDQVFSSDVRLLASLRVDPAGGVYIFQNGTLVSNSTSSSLKPGVYLIYSFEGSYAGISSVNLTRNSSVSVPLQPAFSITLKPNSAGAVIIDTPYGEMSWSGSVLLPAGQYTFTFVKPYNSSAEYFASSTITVSSSRSVYLNSTITNLVSSLEVNAFIAGARTTSGTYYIQGERTVSGYLLSGEINLPYGNYSIYVKSGNLAYFGGFSINSGISFENISLSRAYPLTYGTYLNNSSFNGNISIKNSFANYWVPSNGIIYLPNGSYVFSAQTYSLYYGYKDLYTVNQTAVVSGISSATFIFKIDQILNVKLIPESGSPVMLPNRTFSFPLIVVSNSNIPLSFVIANESSFSITGGTLNLNPYTNGITNITVKSPPGEPAGFNSLDIRVFYGGTYKDIYVNVTIAPVENITATVDNTSGTIVGNRVEFPFNITNRGNVLTNVTATIVNYLQLRYSGVNATINGSEFYNASLHGSEQGHTYIVVTASDASMIPGTTIFVSISYGNETKMITVIPTLPSVVLKEGKGSGSGLSKFSETTQNYYIYGFSVFIVLAMVFVMIIFRRRLRS